MCSDPNSPNPGAFCFMRGMCITMLVFGILDIIGGLSGIQGALADPPCYICPTGGMNFEETAGYACYADFESLGDSNFGSADGKKSTFDEDDCDEEKGEWEAYTCRQAHFVFQGWVQASDNECEAAQDAYEKACCTDGGTPPPDTATNNVVTVLLAIITGIVQSTFGGLLSCCAGPPTKSSMGIAKKFGYVGIFLDFIRFIIAIVSISAISSVIDYYPEAFHRWIWVAAVSAAVFSLLPVGLGITTVYAIIQADKKGIGGAPTVGSVVPQARGIPMATATAVPVASGTAAPDV